MPTPFPNLPPDQRGTVHWLRYDSTCLQGNPWGDPSDRDVLVYTPPAWSGEDPLPAVMVLSGFAGTGEKHLARSLTQVSLATRLDRLIADGCPPFLAVLPDCMTRLGGSQYVDSPGLGYYETYVADELVRAVRTRFPVQRWGVIGHSSGGFGALHLAMNHPGRFEAVACHSGDLGFDLCYLADLPRAVAGVAALGGLERFVDAFWSKEDAGSAAFAALNVLAMACAYDPEPNKRPIPANLPLDFDTGAVDFEALQRWSRYDPIEQIEDPLRAGALRSLRWLYLDCGDRDEHGLQYGARRFAAKLARLEIPHTYEEFPGGHSGARHRWDRSLRELAQRLSTAR